MKWKKLKKIIKTRTAEQIRSHCQKLFRKLKNCKNEEIGIDFTSDNINNMIDILNHIKSVNKTYEIVNVLLYMSEKYSIKSDSNKSKELKKALDLNNIFEEDIKSNTNNKKNFKEVLDINKRNKLFEDKRSK